MTTAVAVEEKQEVATFYSWMGTAGRAGEEHACPSSQVIYISGGDKRVANDGSVVKTPVKEAIFNKGVCRTSDPEIIAKLRKIIREHPGGLSENVEEYYAATLTPQDRVKRQVHLGQQVANERDELIRENQRLKEKLLEAGREESPRRARA
jgi:hypothetical protein